MGRGHSGLIPAHAGKTTLTDAEQSAPAAHPRSRGENVQVTGAALDPKGSSPLTRGKPRPSRPPPRPCGLIPAHAGKTTRPTAGLTRMGAHPRSRGENVCPGVEELGCEWLIPAHAGKTEWVDAPAAAAQAHPRSRGENVHVCSLASSDEGSSPLTRGKR